VYRLAPESRARAVGGENLGKKRIYAMNVRLVIFREDGTRRDFALEQGSTSIGRTTDCTIRIPLAIVSRHHCEITIDGDGVVLKDLGAANGTYLNNRRIKGEEDLEGGDQIMVGPVIFTVQIDGSPTDAEIVKVRTKLSSGEGAGGRVPRVGTSRHVYISDDEIDPIAALEELASSADQTAIHAREDDE